MPVGVCGVDVNANEVIDEPEVVVILFEEGTEKLVEVDL